MATITKDERLNLRIHSDVKENIEAAARLSGLSVSDFVISVAAQAATHIIGEHHALRLSEEEFARFSEAVDQDVPPNAAAREAAKRLNERTAVVDGVRRTP